MSEKKRVTKETVDATVTIVDAAISAFIQVSPLQIGKAVKDAYSSIKANHFIEKMDAMLNETKDIPTEDKDKFLELLDKDKDEFFKRLWIVLDRLDSTEKAVVIGKLFNAYIKQQVQKDIFIRLTKIVDNTYYNDITFLATFYRGEGILNFDLGGGEIFAIKRRLSNAGLLNETIKMEINSARAKVMSGTQPPQPKVSFQVSELGEFLIDFGLSHIPGQRIRTS